MFDLSYTLESAGLIDSEYAYEGIRDIGRGITNFFKNIFKRILGMIRKIKDLFRRRKKDDGKKDPLLLSAPSDTDEDDASSRKERRLAEIKARREREQGRNSGKDVINLPGATAPAETPRKAAPATKEDEWKSVEIRNYLKSVERVLSLLSTALSNPKALQDSEIPDYLKKWYADMLDYENDIQLPKKFTMKTQGVIESLNSMEASAKKALDALNKEIQGNISKEYIKMYNGVLKNITNLYDIYSKVI